MDPFLTATELAAAIRDRSLSPVEVAECYLDRIDRLDTELNAFVWRNDDDVREAARKAEAMVMSGEELAPFHGVPLPIKDLAAVAGQPNTRGSLGISDAPQPESDLIVDRFLSAGFIPMGRTNTAEVGMCQVSENRRYGVTRNPWALDRTSGGSSGGASTAVAAGMAPIAHASDGGGSIRIPASCTGLVGLKPSRGRVPSKLPGWEHCATAGVVSRSTEDAARVLDVISVPDPLGWYQAPPPGQAFAEAVGMPVSPLRVGLLLETPTGVPVDAECRAAAERTAGMLEASGHHIVPVAPDIISAEALDIFLFTVLPASLNTVPYDDPSVAEPFIVKRRELGQRLSAAEYAQGVARFHAHSRRMISHWLSDFDVLLTPSLATKVPPTEVIIADANRLLDGSSQYEAKMLAFMVFANITGLPAISLPVGTDPDGLPIGAQLVGGPFSESLLLAMAAQLERELDWGARRPERFG